MEPQPIPDGQGGFEIWENQVVFGCVIRGGYSGGVGVGHTIGVINLIG